MTNKDKLISLYHYIDMEWTHLDKYELKKALCEGIYQIINNTETQTGLDEAYNYLLDALRLDDENIKESGL